MEVDVLSPWSAIRTVSNYESRKRARSPSSSSSTERSSKRQIAAHPECQGVLDDSNFAPVAMHRMRKGEDEWVDQTRELTIESRSLGGGSCDFDSSVSHVTMGVSMREDIPMTSSGAGDTSMLAPISQAPTSIPQPLIDDSGLHNLPFTPQYASPLVQLAELPFADFPLPYSEISQSAQQPSLHPGDQTIVDASTTMIETDETAPPPSPPGMIYGSDIVPRRVALGYRSNCEKCRQKVPGHWMHILGEDDSEWL